MKRHFLFLLPVLLFPLGSAEARKRPGFHVTRSYTRKDGTRVRSYTSGTGATLSRSHRSRSSSGFSGSSTFATPDFGGGESNQYIPKPIERYTYSSGPTLEPSWVRQQRLERSMGIGVTPRRVAPITTTLAAFTGQCVAVTDGDTLKVLHNGKAETVRLNAIDAPEKAQAFGQQSKSALSKLAFGKSLTVYPTSKDRYGRTLGWVFAGATGLNATQVQTGLAWWYRDYAPKETKISALESAARAARLGLWADTAPPVAPWAWRKTKKST